jgi:lipopolysaccharide export system permease protein
MIKKLDKLILKSFFGPFIVTFFISFFVLTMQTLWKYIDDLVGKGLDFFTIMQFVWYASATLSSLAMPIAILISSIMIFGNLGESFELVAIKSSGISLLRFMRPLVWVTAVLCVITFLFSNYVIPYSNLKFYTLYKDILVKKPAFDLQEGVFYNQIPGYSIRVAKKGKDGETIKDVLIYDASNNLQDNTIHATEGKMSVSPDQNYLEFDLQNGNRYQERGNFMDTSTEYVRLQFREYKKLFDLSILQKQNSGDSNLRNDTKMLSARQLTNNLAGMHHRRDSADSVNKTMLSNMLSLQNNMIKPSSKVADTSGKKLFPDSLSLSLHEQALGQLSSLKSIMLMAKSDRDMRNLEIRYAKIEWHRKFSFSLACMVLFFIGAPLGSIIRKGGLGMPLVVAIIFFLIFHLLNMFGEKFARNGIMEPWLGMWLAVICLTPVGIFFTYKAMKDSQLFNKELYVRFFRRVNSFFPARKKTITQQI